MQMMPTRNPMFSSVFFGGETSVSILNVSKFLSGNFFLAASLPGQSSKLSLLLPLLVFARHIASDRHGQPDYRLVKQLMHQTPVVFQESTRAMIASAPIRHPRIRSNADGDPPLCTCPRTVIRAS